MSFRIGILGTGKIAGLMAETINKMEDATCYAVASRTLEKAEAFAKEYHFEKAYEGYEALVKDDAVDLVYIATPHSKHCENAKLAFAYQKPVLCEKSFTVNATQAKELVALAKENKIFIAEAMWTRYMPMLTTIKECLEQGLVGVPKMLTANLGYTISNVDRITNPQLAGGGLLDVGVYPLNFAAMTFGTAIKNMQSFCTYTSTGVDEQGGMILEYEDGKMAVLNYSTCTISDRMGIIHGDKGYMVIHNINNYEKIVIYNNEYQVIKEINTPHQISGYEHQVRACMEAIKANEIECKQMPHSEIIKMMEWMDSLRKAWGISYPCE